MPLAACGPNKKTIQIHIDSNDASIVGGQIVDKEVFVKHVVALLNVTDGMLCTATLIDKNLILTAAHCANTGTASDYEVVFTKATRFDRSVRRNVNHIRVHAYNPKSYYERNDLALLRFDGDLPAGYEPMPLPSEQDLKAMGRSFYATGFGTVTGRKDLTERQSGVLRYVQVAMNEPSLTATMPQFTLNQQNGHGICFGDSGGPAFVKIGDRRVLIGVASAVFSMDKEARKKTDFDICLYHSIYMSTYYHLPWIQRTAADMASF